jgi:hypothetical protein
MHWEAQLSFLGQSVTFVQELPEVKKKIQKQSKNPTTPMIHRDVNLFSLEMITRKGI